MGMLKAQKASLNDKGRMNTNNCHRVEVHFGSALVIGCLILLRLTAFWLTEVVKGLIRAFEVLLNCQSMYVIILLMFKWFCKYFPLRK